MEGASGDWIPKLREKFGIEAFDLVFLDHWKDRYLPDTKLMEVRLVVTLQFGWNAFPGHSAMTQFLFFQKQECGLLREGSVLLADNVICPGTPDYLEYVRHSPRYKSQYFRSHLEYTKVEDGLEKSVFLG